MNHVHSTLGVPGKNLHNYIFAFEAQNEAMIGFGHQYLAVSQVNPKTLPDVLFLLSSFILDLGDDWWSIVAG